MGNSSGQFRPGDDCRHVRGLATRACILCGAEVSATTPTCVSIGRRRDDGTAALERTEALVDDELARVRGMLPTVRP
jgi:hypothetical protein